MIFTNISKTWFTGRLLINYLNYLIFTISLFNIIHRFVQLILSFLDKCLENYSITSHWIGSKLNMFQVIFKLNSVYVLSCCHKILCVFCFFHKQVFHYIPRKCSVNYFQTYCIYQKTKQSSKLIKWPFYLQHMHQLSITYLKDNNSYLHRVSHNKWQISALTTSKPEEFTSLRSLSTA